MQTPTNEERVGRIYMIIGGFYEEDPPNAVVDLMTDLRHYCYHENIDIDNLISMSEMHFNSESEGE